MIEPLPLRVDGSINPQLMSYARLFKLEIMNYFKHVNAPEVYQKYADLIGQGKYADQFVLQFEWFVDEILRNERAFEELYNDLLIQDAVLMSQIRMLNAPEKSIQLFQQHFLRPSPGIEYKPLAQGEDLEDEGPRRKRNEDGDVVDAETNEALDDSLFDADDGSEFPTERVGELSIEEEFGPNQFTVLDRVAACLEPQYLLHRLTVYKSLADLKDPLNSPSSSPVKDTRPWAAALLRSLPYVVITEDDEKYPPLLYNFADACSHDPCNRVALMYFFPDYKEKMQERSDANRKKYQTNDVKIDFASEVPKEGCRKQEDFKKKLKVDPMDEVNVGDVNYPEFPLRNYQKELCEPALRGKNTVIVAPTGCGKTVVACKIIEDHIYSHVAEQKPFRVVMVVPKIVLVEQQARHINQYLKGEFDIAFVHGDEMFTDNTKIVRVLSHHVIVSTPQTLINLLTSIKQDERLYVSDVTLIVLDECHHTDKNNPYNVLMGIVNNFPAPFPRPQIVGLSASLGVGRDGTMNQDSAREHIVSLCANMGVDTISTIRKNLEELLQYVEPPTDLIQKVDPPTTGCPFTNEISRLAGNVKNDVVDRLKKVFNQKDIGVRKEDLERVVTNGKNLQLKLTSAFFGWLDSMKQVVKPLTDGSLKANINHSLSVLKIYCECHAMNDLLPADAALSRTATAMQNLASGSGSSDHITDFFTLYPQLKEFSQTELFKDSLKKLVENIRNQLRDLPDSRILIFVMTREMAEILSAFLNEETLALFPAGKKAEYLMSTSNKSSRENRTATQSSGQQRKVVEGFKQGRYPVVVATSVAEEGLDISSCNLIIRYNKTDSLIQAVQTRGRARAKGSKSILIVLHDSVRRQELINITAEKMMNMCVANIYKEGADKLKADIQKRAQEMKERREAEERAEEAKKMELQGRSYSIMCVNCNQVICESSSMRIACNHYVTTSEEVWEKADIRLDEKKTAYIDESTSMLGKIHCKGTSGENCGNELGKAMYYASCYFATIDSTKIQLRDLTTGKNVEMEGTRKMRWERLREMFFVPRIIEEDKMRVLQSMVANNIDVYEKLQSAARHTIERAKRLAQAERLRREKKPAQYDEEWN